MAARVFAVDFLIFTLMLKVAVPILLGEFQTETEPGADASTARRPPLQPVVAGTSPS